MTHKILVLPGDGIGPEICTEALKVVDVLKSNSAFDCSIEQGLIGGCAYDEFGAPYPEQTHAQALAADAILMGAVGGPKWDELPRESRPERGLLAIRAKLELFANLRPALTYAALANASSLKPELVAGLDILIVRELTGGIYFGEPRGIDGEPGSRKGYSTLVYTEQEIERIARVGFEAAQKRGKRLCSVDKANVLDSMMLWREVVTNVAKDYPDVELSHMYVDNAAMQLVRAPKQFDVILTGNMFGDILSDCAAMLTGSIGMLPSASLNKDNKGLYEPVHGSAPDITGQNKANPLATILSLAMLLRYSLGEGQLADKIELAVDNVLASGARTGDIAETGANVLSTQQMGDAVCAELIKLG